MIFIIREAPLVGELLDISHDRLLPYDNAEKPLLPGFNRFVLQAAERNLVATAKRLCEST